MKSIIKNTTGLAVVKAIGTNVTETIAFEENLLAPNQTLGGESKVNILFAQWSISAGTSDQILITRGGTQVLSLRQNTGELDMGGNYAYSDSINSLDDIVIQIVGTGMVYLTLRKQSGFNTFPAIVEDGLYYQVGFNWYNF